MLHLPGSSNVLLHRNEGVSYNLNIWQICFPVLVAQAAIKVEVLMLSVRHLIGLITTNIKHVWWQKLPPAGEERKLLHLNHKLNKSVRLTLHSQEIGDTNFLC